MTDKKDDDCLYIFDLEERIKILEEKIYVLEEKNYELEDKNYELEERLKEMAKGVDMPWKY